MEKKLIELAQEIRALAENGLTYSLSEYDTERYEKLITISHEITSCLTGIDREIIRCQYSPQREYLTPKVDIRAVIFNEKKEVLLVKEKADGLWALPGGWADVGSSPSEMAIREVKEETGLDVKVSRLLAVTDMSRHPHPPTPFYAYKLFILCETCGGTFSEAFDILDKGFFLLDSLPSLSLERVLPEQIEQMFDYYIYPEKGVYLD